MTQAKAAFGTSLARAGNVIAEITDFGDLEVLLNLIEVTNHQSPDSHEEHIPDEITRVPEFTVEGNFIAGDTNGQIAMKGDLDNKTAAAYVLAFPDGTQWSFNAYVTRFKVSAAPINGKLKFSATLKPSSKPNLTTVIASALTALVVTTGTLVPAFAGGTIQYVVNIATDQTTVTVTPTCAAADSITVDGVVVASGVASGAINLGAAGSITECEVIVYETSKAPKKYTLLLTRAAA